MVATQELEAGDVLRRFKAEVSQDEPRRGNRHTRSTSARCLELVTIHGNLLTCVGVFVFFDATCACAYWCELFCLVMFYIFVQHKVTAFAC